jgi:hypothetical protein
MVTGLPAIRRTRRRPAQSGAWGIEGQHRVVVELQEPHQADAALRLPDQGAELLVGGAGRELAVQLPDVGLADAAEDAVQDAIERPFAVEDVAVHEDFEYLLGCHVDAPFARGDECREGGARVEAWDACRG